MLKAVRPLHSHVYYIQINFNSSWFMSEKFNLSKIFNFWLCKTEKPQNIIYFQYHPYLFPRNGQWINTVSLHYS